MRYLIAISLALLSVSCSEFFSKDVTAVTLEINSPKDSLFTTYSDISFWWEEDDQVENYRFQLVTPNFDNPFLLLDTLMEESTLYMNLLEGVYTWRLRAENEGSESSYQRRFLVIDQTAPTAARATYPQVGDTLSFGTDPLRLQWISEDAQVDGFQFGVRDSVYFYENTQGTLSLKGRYLTSQKEVNFTGELGGFTPGEAQDYTWQVKTFDQAGNERLSPPFQFVLR